MTNLVATIINTLFLSSTVLETEHSLVMLLLLYGLLTYRGEKLTKWVPFVVLGGILLSLVTPVHRISLFWPVITGLIVPPFLWQAAIAVTKSGLLRYRLNLLIWAATISLVSFSLFQFSGLPLSNALLLGILAVTLLWYFRELNVDRTFLSTLGLIALVVLLAEIDLTLDSFKSWLGTLFSGIAIGFALGFLGINIYRKVKQRVIKKGFFFAWAYLAYLTGYLLGISAIATTLATALVVATYGFSIGLWFTQKSIPVPSNTPLFFYITSIVWITLGWQAHTTIDMAGISGILAAMIAITLAILVTRRYTPISTENRVLRLLRKETRVFLLLFGSILFWPKHAYLTTLDVEIALIGAVLLVILLRYSIPPLFELLGVQLSWPSDSKDS
jgi:hypothetical protein